MILRVLIVDDHPLMRAGIRTLLERTMKDVEVEAVDGLEAIELAARKSPDIVLMDISMPGHNGVEAARRVMAIAPAAKVIMLSMHQDRLTDACEQRSRNQSAVIVDGAAA